MRVGRFLELLSACLLARILTEKVAERRSWAIARPLGLDVGWGRRMIVRGVGSRPLAMSDGKIEAPCGRGRARAGAAPDRTAGDHAFRRRRGRAAGRSRSRAADGSARSRCGTGRPRRAPP